MRLRPFGIGNQPENGIPEILMQDGGTGINFEQLFDELYRDEGKGYTPEEFDNVSRKFFREGNLPDVSWNSAALYMRDLRTDAAR